MHVQNLNLVICVCLFYFHDVLTCKRIKGRQEEDMGCDSKLNINKL